MTIDILSDILTGNMTVLTFNGTKVMFPKCLVDHYFVGSDKFADSYVYGYDPVYARILLEIMLTTCKDSHNEFIEIPNADFIEFLDKYIKLDKRIVEFLVMGYPMVTKDIYTKQFQETFVELFQDEHKFMKHFTWNITDNTKCNVGHTLFKTIIRNVLTEDPREIVFKVQDKIFSGESEKDKILNMLNYVWHKYCFNDF